ncbi:MAG TPA: N-acetylmuramoyl-L-alanine amidase [Elusimicrobiales bacterium]|nr:N-acetylmuramoyl-L-alanine amidase [Elusimicrobiales bacterium]
MKKIFSVLSVFLFSISLYCGVGKYKVFKKDKYIGAINYYEVNEKIYFDLNDAVKILNARKDVYSVSSRVIIYLNGKKLNISKDSVNYDNLESINVSKPVIIRASRYFVLSDIFVNPLFSKVFEIKVDLDNKSKIMGIYEDINVTGIKFFSYIEKTRVVIYMSKELKYNTDVVGRSVILTVFEGSYITQNENLNVSDGNIKDINVSQDKKTLKVAINMGENYGSYDIFTLKDPDRIVIDIKPKVEAEENRIGKVIEPTSSASQSSATFVLPDKIKKNYDKKVIVIDAGHGGKDPGGRVLFGKKEKQINLEIAKKVYELFKKDPNFEPVLTRDSDEFIPLYERSKKANDLKCDIFVSIHSNAHKNKNENGYEIYFLSEKATDPWASDVADYENASVEYEDKVFDYTGAALVLHSLARNEYINEGSKIAAYITKEISKNTPFANRGIKQAAFYVLRGTYCPGVLVEVGFMTNKKDKANLDNSSVQEKVARSIYKGIAEYEKQHK